MIGEVPNQLQTANDTAVICSLEKAIAGGQHWYLALLDAVRNWQAPVEFCNERVYCYLIAGEAFDWLLLAERLCLTVSNLIPQDEMMALLFHGQPPLNLERGKFRTLVGLHKYHQFLNYFYGVTVEEFLALAVRDEVRKERHALHQLNEMDIDEEVYHRIYGAGKRDLLHQFRSEKGYPHLRSTTMTEMREFTYWLFKFRLKHCDKARVASDTKKGLEKYNKSFLRCIIG